MAKESDNQHFPCFFRRVKPHLPSSNVIRQTSYQYYTPSQPGSSSHFTDDTLEEQVQPREPNDFTKWIDQAPLTVSCNASMEMVLELFVKMGVKTLLVVEDGRYVGRIHKKLLLGYLKENEDKKHLYVHLLSFYYEMLVVEDETCW